MDYNASGKRIMSIIAGSFYQHYEGYRGPQENAHWQGCFMLNEVNHGEFDPMPVSMTYLKRKFG